MPIASLTVQAEVYTERLLPVCAFDGQVRYRQNALGSVLELSSHGSKVVAYESGFHKATFRFLRHYWHATRPEPDLVIHFGGLPGFGRWRIDSSGFSGEIQRTDNAPHEYFYSVAGHHFQVTRESGTRVRFPVNNPKRALRLVTLGFYFYHQSVERNYD